MPSIPAKASAKSARMPAGPATYTSAPGVSASCRADFLDDVDESLAEVRIQGDDRLQCLPVLGRDRRTDLPDDSVQRCDGLQVGDGSLLRLGAQAVLALPDDDRRENRLLLEALLELSDSCRLGVGGQEAGVVVGLDLREATRERAERSADEEPDDDDRGREHTPPP